MSAPLRRLNPAAGPPDADGRRRRSQDSRARIVQAMLELVMGGETAPAAEQVAARASVGLRTVFRHFKDMDSLYGEMAAAIETELRAIVDEPLKGRAKRERVLELVARRGAVYEKITPFRRAADVHRHDSAFLQAAHLRMVQISREILARELPAQDAARFEAIDLLLSFEAWLRLRQDQGLSVGEAQAVVRDAVQALMR